MRRLNGITDSTDMSLSKLGVIVKGREAWCAAVHGVAKESEMTSSSLSFFYKLPSKHYLVQIPFCS